jgi:predicted AlkP superfamily phosphohydrolase/phosphomutase
VEGEGIMPAKVVVLGLDSAEPWVIDHYIEQGRLPHIAQLRDRGAFGLTRNFHYYKAEPAFTTFMTGAWPTDTGYWGRIQYHADELDVREYGTYDFQEYPMFWELGADYKVCAFDLPQSELSSSVHGTQVVAWGAHTPRRAPGSIPKGELQRLHALFGPHPTLNQDNVNLYVDKEVCQLKRELEIGLERRRQIALDYLAREDWDMFLATFGEVHAAEHQYWHYAFDHPLKEHMAEEGRDDLGDILEQVDAAIGDIAEAAGPDATIILYAAHGMAANKSDQCSFMFLPEMMYRWNFGSQALAGNPAGTPPPPLRFDYPRHMKHEIWDLMTPEGQSRLQSPKDQEQLGMSLHWQPANWYKKVWPEMRAFAIPSYSEGYIRLSVKGRDKAGLLDPAEYDTVCDEMEAFLLSWRCARTGAPLIDHIVRPRPDGTTKGEKLPDADLVVIWANTAVTDIIESESYGQIGPVPFFRTGDHTTNGFVLAAGPGIPAGHHLAEGQTIDMAPTILNRLGAPVPPHMKGRDLLAS